LLTGFLGFLGFAPTSQPASHNNNNNNSSLRSPNSFKIPKEVQTIDMDTNNNEEVDAARRGQRYHRHRQRDAREHQLDVDQSTRRHQPRQHIDASIGMMVS
jgi:hypothetical protein